MRFAYYPGCSARSTCAELNVATNRVAERIGLDLLQLESATCTGARELRAIDPVSGKIAWEHKEQFPLWAGTLTTAGGLLFTGTSDGYIKAFDQKTGKELWKFQTGSGIVSIPVTWEMDGEQYIGIQSGYGGAVPLWGGDMAELTKQVSQGGSMWVFKLPKQVASR